MSIFVNGKEMRVESGTTVSKLLFDLKVNAKYAAVELNLNILDRSQYDTALLKDNDKVEIILPVGGGSGATSKKALVIVESPAKSRTIEKFLGRGYVVCASMGHVIDLPSRKMGVDIANDFKPNYVVIAKKKKLLSDLKKEAKDKDKIYLATDPDREGEAIGWHLANYIGKNKEIVRVVFHEITKKAIEEAFAAPGQIDIKLVNAQQARRILDRIVGYSLSPLLWKKVTRGLSAGRVQSVAVKLIVDRERQIQAFIPQEYWEIEAELKKITSQEPEISSFVAKLEKIGEEKADIKDKTQADSILSDLADKKFKVKDVKQSSKRLNPQPPFTTSKLQQEAFNKLHFRAGKTMKIAQQLYEGLDIGGEGPIGLITYMRTDSVKAAFSAIEEARFFIKDKFGVEHLPAVPCEYKSKKAAQEAHEAIRPASVNRQPDSLKDFLTPDQYKLYNLIWKKFVASQMKPAEYAVTSVDIEVPLNGKHLTGQAGSVEPSGGCGAKNYLFRAAGSVLVFAGFKAVYDDEEDNKDTKTASLPPMKQEELLDLIKLNPTQHFTKAPGRYTDATLVKALEEDGIGRPSTYAPTIETIVLRHYVKRDGASLIPTELGMVVTDLLTEHFPVILDEKFTARMEEELDEIEEGKLEWTQVLKDFYTPFSEWLSKAAVEMKEVKRDVVETGEICEKCGKPLVIKWGRRGKFISCSGFPECKNAKPISTGVRCPEPGCSGELVERRSRRGLFYGCSRYPDCKHIENKLTESED